MVVVGLLRLGLKFNLRFQLTVSDACCDAVLHSEILVMNLLLWEAAQYPAHELVECALLYQVL